MRFIKSLLAVICSISLIFSATNVFATSHNSENSNKNSGFTDVSPDYWAYDSINTMVQMGILQGDGKGNFNPEGKVTRAQFSKMMVLLLNLELKNPETSTFKDLTEGSWQYQYVETAKYYLTGFRTSEGDYFKPDEPAVREDMAVALVKALKYDISNADESVLDSFYDSNAISTNLRKYVATAVSNGIMEGSVLNGSDKKAFAPQDALTRASAAAMLCRLITTEKVTYDQDEKVTYDDGTVPVENVDNTDTSYDKAKVTGKIENGKLVLRWNKIDDDRFVYYKVVVSKSNPYPSYPNDGYLYCISDKDQNYAVIDNSSTYNGGDFGGHLVEGQKYYFSITVVYNDIALPGNVIQFTYPQTEDKKTSRHMGATVTGKVQDNSIVLNWNKINSEDFQGYKVVISKGNSKPKYPDDGYLYFITDRNQTTAVVDNSVQYNGGDFDGQLQPGETYYFSITVLYSNEKIAGNVISLTYPG